MNTVSLRDLKSIEERREHIEKEKGVKLDALSVYPKDLAKAASGNCENMIGAVHVPLGIAGPLRIFGVFATGDYYIPLATTEGALVASVNRGCKAITVAGGAKVATHYVGMTRGPVFATESLAQSLALKEWVHTHMKKLRSIASLTSSHIALTDCFIRVIGKNVYIRFYYDTQDAMGMNMATYTTDVLVAAIETETKARCVSLAGNFDTDKKPSWLNSLLGRGRQVWAETVVPEHILKSVLKTTSKALHEVHIKKCFVGSIMSGSIGFNAHAGNAFAALFLACGQDVAHVSEGSVGVTSTDVVSDGLYITVCLPDVAVGTVGGGTGMPAQSQALSILGCEGGNKGRNAAKFAEILGGVVLASELSLLASLSEGSLAASHRKLTRRK